jgi:succinoglycan biosynthesis protein ExoV
MLLTYHKGQNFGDALNPVIWNHFLPNFFDDDNNHLFLGFGTILGK